jgi:hypothetical protein
VVAEFTGEDLTGSRFEDVYLTGALFHDVDLSNASFRVVDLSGVTIRGAALVNVDISGDCENLLVNGVDVVPFVEAGRSRRLPRGVGHPGAAVAADSRAGQRDVPRAAPSAG